MRSRYSILTALLAALPAAEHARAHGDVHESIVRLTHEIEARAPQAGLLRERANLYTAHGDFDKALADVQQAATLEPENDVHDALRGEVLRRLGRLAEARTAQETYLKKHPLQQQVRWDYCRTLAEAKDTPAALRELDALIATAEHPSPDAVALRLSITENAGPDGAAQALVWLDAFLAKHPLPVFQDHALRLETALGRTEAAVKRLDAMIAAAPRKETLLLRKAALLLAAGDRPAAAAAALAAQQAIARLPQHLHSTPATAALLQEIPRYLSPTP